MNYLCKRTCCHGRRYEAGEFVPESELLRAGPVPGHFAPVDETGEDKAVTELEALRRRADEMGLSWAPSWNDAQLAHAITVAEQAPPKAPEDKEQPKDSPAPVAIVAPTYDMKALRTRATELGIKAKREWKGQDFVEAITVAEQGTVNPQGE